MAFSIANRKATEYFLRDVANALADVTAVVVTDFSDIDQEIIITLCKALQMKNASTTTHPVRGEIYIIHNFKTADVKQARELWKVSSRGLFLFLNFV
jgi:hypothetical protein